jgi:5-methylcytosine-specific restriction endonuclease McrA
MNDSTVTPIEQRTCKKCGKTKNIGAFKPKRTRYTRKDGSEGVYEGRDTTCAYCRKLARKKNQPVAVMASNRLCNARWRAKKMGCEVVKTAREAAIYREALALEAMDGIKRHVDHIVPLADGGVHCADNMQILTAEEHKAKSSAERKAKTA